MASIVKRGKPFSLVYEYKDAEGVKRQKWETYPTKKASADPQGPEGVPAALHH